jgi:hypothetical protein
MKPPCTWNFLISDLSLSDLKSPDPEKIETDLEVGGFGGPSRPHGPTCAQVIATQLTF